MADYERLSPTDASFLYWETPVATMHVGGLVITEAGNADFETICDHISARLALVPRFRKRLMWVPLGQGRPVWVDDEHFDIRYHVRHTGLPHPGTERELLDLVGRIMSRPLDRKRPLWEFWIVDLHDGRQALINKTHHCLIDGASGVDLAAVLFDLTPDVAASEPQAWEPVAAPSKERLLAETLIERTVRPAEVVRSLRAALRAPNAALERAREIAQGIGSVGRVPFEARNETSLDTAKLGSHRRFELIRTDLGQIKKIKDAFGCTVNDVVLAIVAGGLRHFLAGRGDDIDGITLRATIPVSVRTEEQRMTMGNQVAAMFADLPVGEADPAARISFVQDQMRGIKDTKQAVGVDAMARLGEFASPTLLSLAGRVVAQQWVMNLVVTNVPGPQFPLYFLGSRVEVITPFAPLVGHTAVAVACLSYNGGLAFGVTGDWDATPDLAEFGAALEAAVAELAELV